jgi:hypothetical protein
MLKKAVFYVDNVDSSVSANDLVEFVTSLSVNVISCFVAKPRRRRTNNDDCKAFRLCVSDDSGPRLLDADSWPAFVSISDCFLGISI